MNSKQIITGKIISGTGQGAFFTQLDWVQEQCLEKLGFKPYPGTLNIDIPEEMAPVIEEILQQKQSIELIPPDSNFCSGKVFPVVVEGLRAAVVLPADEVRVHGKNIIEVISSVSLKDALAVEDGDIVDVVVESAAPGQMVD